MNSLTSFYIAQIEEATTLEQLNYIVEQSAWTISDNADYELICTKAEEKIRGGF